MMNMLRANLIPLSAALCLLASMLFGIFVQDAADPKMMIPFALLSGWLMVSGRLLKFSLKDAAFLGLMLLWIFWGVSILHSEYPFNSKVTWIIMSTLPVSYLFWRGADFDQRWIKIICSSFLGIGLILAIYAVMQVTIFRDTAKWSGRADFPYADPNMLGIHFALTLLPLIPLIIKPLYPKNIRIFLGIAALILAAGLLATYSRSALLGSGAGFLLTLYLLRLKINWTRDLKGRVTLAGLIAFVALLLTGMAKRFTYVFTERGDSDISGRLSLWQTAFEMSMNKPLLGYGFGTFGNYYPMFRQASDTSSAGWWVHMDPLQWAVESGWQTPITFYLLVLYVCIKMWQQHKDKTLTAFQAGCAGGLLCLFLNAHTAYPLHVIPFIMIATGMMIALLPKPAPSSSPRQQMVFATSLLLSLLMMFWIAIKCASTLYLWQDMNVARQNGDAARYRADFQTCIEKGDPQFAYCKLALIEAYLGTRDIDEAKFKKLVEESRAYNPYLPQPDFYLGMYYLQGGEGNLDRAIESFRASLTKNPTYWLARKNMVLALYQSRRYYEALQALEKGADYPLPASDEAFFDQTRKDLKKIVYGQE